MNRERIKRMINDPCAAPGTRPTIQGYRFILLTFLLAVAAVNTANNLIYLVLAMIAAMVVVSLAGLPGSLKALRLRLYVPHPVHAGSLSRLTVVVRRDHPRPVFDIHIRIPGTAPAGSASRARIGRIEGQGSAECTLPFKPTRRGRFRVQDLLVSTGFPFGLIMKTLPLRQNRSILVYPALLPMQRLRLILSSVSAGRELSLPGPDGTYLFDRRYQHGDSLRHVHWKASARTGRLLVKEYSSEEPVRVTLHLETGPGIPEPLFERAVSMAASIAAYLSESGTYVRLLCGKADTGFGTGTEHMYSMFDHLAVIEAEDGPTLLPGPGSGYAVAISSRDIPHHAGAFALVINAAQEL